MITKPTDTSVSSFLENIEAVKRQDAEMLIDLMHTISGEEPIMWGPSIIGFGSQHYKYATGREGDMPRLGFSPRKANLTIYFNEGFNQYTPELSELGKYKLSVSCLYINKLADINIDVLGKMLEKSFIQKITSP